jgi:hypothetical protein
VLALLLKDQDYPRWIRKRIDKSYYLGLHTYTITKKEYTVHQRFWEKSTRIRELRQNPGVSNQRILDASEIKLN